MGVRKPHGRRSLGGRQPFQQRLAFDNPFGHDEDGPWIVDIDLAKRAGVNFDLASSDHSLRQGLCEVVECKGHYYAVSAGCDE